MKIEKVNDHQIRCTLTREDLADRELKLSELAYGTEKAKDLFRDMMQQASYEFGFEAEDIPLMIEAIPLNSECIVLIITKVEDPEELDTRSFMKTMTRQKMFSTRSRKEPTTSSICSRRSRTAMRHLPARKQAIRNPVWIPVLQDVPSRMLYRKKLPRVPNPWSSQSFMLFPLSTR